MGAQWDTLGMWKSGCFSGCFRMAPPKDWASPLADVRPSSANLFRTCTAAKSSVRGKTESNISSLSFSYSLSLILSPSLPEALKVAGISTGNSGWNLTWKTFCETETVWSCAIEDDRSSDCERVMVACATVRLLVSGSWELRRSAQSGWSAYLYQHWPCVKTWRIWSTLSRPRSTAGSSPSRSCLLLLSKVVVLSASLSSANNGIWILHDTSNFKKHFWQPESTTASPSVDSMFLQLHTCKGTFLTRANHQRTTGIHWTCQAFWKVIW